MARMVARARISISQSFAVSTLTRSRRIFIVRTAHCCFRHSAITGRTDPSSSTAPGSPVHQAQRSRGGVVPSRAAAGGACDSERVFHAETREAGKVTVAGQQLRDAMFQAERRDVRVVDEVGGSDRGLEHARHDVCMPGRLAQEHHRW